MRLRLILLLVLVLTGKTLFAQEYAEGLSPHQAGPVASSISGYGAGYAYNFNANYRLKATILFYYSNNDNSATYLTLLGGLELQRTLQTSSMTRFYGFIGGYVYHHRYEDQYTYASEGSLFSYSNHIERDYAVGGGIGFEVLLWGHVVVNLDGGLQYFTSQFSPTSYNSGSQEFGMGGGVGIMYRF